MPFGGLLTAGIGAGTSLIGGLFGASAAAKQAAALKQAGIDNAHALEKATGQAIDAGYAGLNQANTALGTGYDRATGAITAGRDAATGAVRQGVAGANQALTDAYGRQIGFLSPYLTAGQTGLEQLQAFMAPGGAGTRPFTASMMSQFDPGYQFRLQQGADAIAKSAAARGASMGGGTERALANYQQNLASSEFGNAYDRYMRGQQQTYNMLSGLANYGERASNLAVGAAGELGRGASGNLMTGAQLEGGYDVNAGSQLGNAALSTGSNLANTAMQGNQWIGNVGLTGARDAADMYMTGAAGNAAGRMAGTNALWSGIGGAVNNIGGGLLNYYAARPQVSGNVPIQMPAWSGDYSNWSWGTPPPVPAPPVVG